MSEWHSTVVFMSSNEIVKFEVNALGRFKIHPSTDLFSVVRLSFLIVHFYVSKLFDPSSYFSTILCHCKPTFYFCIALSFRYIYHCKEIDLWGKSLQVQTRNQILVDSAPMVSCWADILEYRKQQLDNFLVIIICDIGRICQISGQHIFVEMTTIWYCLLNFSAMKFCVGLYWLIIG